MILNEASHILDITGDLRIQLDVGPHGKFFRLFRGSKWMSISLKGWQNIMNNRTDISTAMMNESYFYLMISPNKSVTTRKFNDRMYASFCEQFELISGTSAEKYINFNDTEWNAFEAVVPAMERLLERDVAYKDLLGNWSFVKDHQTAKFRLVKCVTDDDVNFLLAAYLIRKKLREKIAAENLSWTERVDAGFVDAYRTLRLSEAINKLNDRLKWRIEQGSFVGRLDQLKKAVQDPSCRNCDAFKDRDVVLFNTFDTLKL